MLQQNPRRRGTILPNQVLTRPTILLNHRFQFPRMTLVYLLDARRVTAVKLAAGRKLFPHVLVFLQHFQEALS
jgi:hypothetical protein